MHITRDRSARTISLDQSKYLRDILAKYGMTDSKPSSLPMHPGFLAGLAHMTSPPLTGVAKDVYPSLLGSLQYAAVCTRPETVAYNIIVDDHLRTPLEIDEHPCVLLKSPVDLIECHQRVDGVVAIVGKKRLLLQYFNQLCYSSRDLSSSLGV
jgi:hypothetical protein